MGKEVLVPRLWDHKGLGLIQALFEFEQMSAFFDSHELLCKTEITFRSQGCYEYYKYVQSTQDNVNAH